MGRDGAVATQRSYAHRHGARRNIVRAPLPGEPRGDVATKQKAFRCHGSPGRCRSSSQAAAELADQEEQGLREELHRIAMALDLRETDAPQGNATTVAFIEEGGRMSDVVKRNGRLADLIVVARPDHDSNLGANALKAALFQTGRPVMMCPRGGVAAGDFGARIAVAWNGSLEAARTVGLTLALAEAAEAVTVLSGGSGEPHGASTEELVAYYGLRGISAKVHRFEAKNPGAALLRKTVEVGAQILVMGAYGHSHEHETLFGGNTQAVVDTAEIPVVMAH